MNFGAIDNIDAFSVYPQERNVAWLGKMEELP